MKSILRALAVAGSMALSAGLANAATITNLDGTFSFSGFDWSQEGQALITGYDVTNASATGTVDAFTLQYQATAVAIIDGNGTNIPGALTPGLNLTYEYTIYATFSETATCLDAIPGGATCDTVLITVTGGTFTIFYDTTPDANYAAGTGFTDGTTLICGTVTSATPVVAPQGATNPGDASLSPTIFADVTCQSNLITPTLVGSRATTTLQFGATIGNTWVAPASFNGVPVCNPQTNSCFLAQADANQTFTQVPEPASLALVGLGLLGFGFFRFGRRART